MYSLELMDGTVISNITKLNPSTYMVEGDSHYYFLLNDNNLACATLYNEDNEIEDILIDYMMHSYSWQNNVAVFRLASIESMREQERHKQEKEKLKRRKKYALYNVEDELEQEEKG